MRNPNGYGTVAKLSGQRRRPYIVKKTIGWNDKGHPIYDIIGYAETREAGNIMLAEYNRDPWDVDRAKITLQQLFNLWKEKKAPKLNHTPHECRHTFETKLDSAGANRKCIDLLMGHVSKDTGNRVYNHKTLDELKATVELIP